MLFGSVSWQPVEELLVVPVQPQANLQPLQWAQLKKKLHLPLLAQVRVEA